MLQMPAARINFWNPSGRFLVFGLSFSSIACLLLELYHVCPMRAFTLYVFVPCLLLLVALALADLLIGSKTLAKALLVGASAGLLAAIAYDLFRLPFVFSERWGLQAIFPALNLF